MRILHSSDWHLGVSSGPVSRGRDHDLFLAWLAGRIEALGVDALVVAGDVFDSMQPSAEALARYYGFLAGLRGSGVGDVVIVGGNHDSAARLDAPREILAALRVHVVGGLDDLDDPTRYVVPLRDRAGEVAAACLAVPYVNEFRLGVRTTDPDHAAVRAEFTTHFTALYARLVDAALAAWPDRPLIATGHLALGPTRREDYPQEIHQVGRIEGLPDSVLDARLRYVALGHIHRPCPVAGGRAWYSGSPVALSLAEAAVPRRVLCVDLPAGAGDRVTVTPLEVPTFRALREVEGSADEVVDQVRRLAWAEPLPPLLYCRVRCEVHDPLLHGRILEALGSFPEAARPGLAEVRDLRPGPATAPVDAQAADLRELRPEEVFAALLRTRGIEQIEARAALTAAFMAAAGAMEGKDDAFFTRIAGDRP